MRKAHVITAVPAQVHGRHLFAANQPHNPTSPAAPKHREDIQGAVKGSLEDFESGLRGELATSDAFIFDVTDTANYSQWKDYLTHDEMRRVFLRVMTEARAK